jgi:hypothetical protein
MRSDQLEIVDGMSAGQWIRDAIGNEFGSIASLVPRKYEAYARIFHPALDFDLNPVRWVTAANRFGTVAHRNMQWHAILGLPSAGQLNSSYERGSRIGSQGIGFDPQVGGMNVAALEALYDILVRHTRSMGECFIGLCTIEGWLDSFSVDESKLLKLPLGRDYIVLTGPLSALSRTLLDDERLVRPNLIWSMERSWFVVSDVDLDSTLVGGSKALIDALVKSPKIEARQVEPSDSIAVDADEVNVTEK